MFFICLTAVSSSILNCHEKFSIPAFTPAILNIILIISVLFFSTNFNEPVYALAWGLLFAGIVQLIFVLYPLVKMGLFPKVSFNKNHPGIKKIKELMLPVIFGSSVTQINLIFDTIIASFLITGSISWLYMSDRFIELPLALFGISIATVLLPKLSEYYNNSDRESYNSTINWGLKLSVLISIPTSIGLILLAKPIIITLLQYREFSPNDVSMTSLSLVAFACGLPGMIGAKILITNYYSQKNTRYPVKAAVISVIANFVMNLTFVYYLTSSDFKGAHVGLALATSLSAYINFILLFANAIKTKILEIDKRLNRITVLRNSTHTGIFGNGKLIKGNDSLVTATILNNNVATGAGAKLFVYSADIGAVQELNILDQGNRFTSDAVVSPTSIFPMLITTPTSSLNSGTKIVGDISGATATVVNYDQDRHILKYTNLKGSFLQDERVAYENIDSFLSLIHI